MTESDGLSALKMGISRHNCGFIFLSLINNSAQKLFYKLGNAVDLIAQIHSYIKGNLVVSASCGVELFANIAQTLC